MTYGAMQNVIPLRQVSFETAAFGLKQLQQLQPRYQQQADSGVARI